MKHVGGANMLGVAAICGAELIEVKTEVKGVMRFVHESELLVDKAQDSDCAACRQPLLRHIAKHSTSSVETVCGAPAIAPSVHAAMASDCDDCRTAVGVALVRDKAWSGESYGVRPEAVFESEPMAEADEICASARANR